MDGSIRAIVQLNDEDQKVFAKHARRLTRKKPGPLKIMLYALVPTALAARYLITGRADAMDFALAGVLLLVLLLAGNRANHDRPSYRMIYSQAMTYVVRFLDACMIVETSDLTNPAVHRYAYDDIVEARRDGKAFYLFVGANDGLVLPERCLATGVPEQLAGQLKEKLGDRFRG